MISLLKKILLIFINVIHTGIIFEMFDGRCHSFWFFILVSFIGVETSTIDNRCTLFLLGAFVVMVS